MKPAEKIKQDKRPSIPDSSAVAVPEADYRLLFESVPDPCLVLDPRLRVVAVNAAYLSATMTKQENILGRDIFEVFPDNPDEPDATGVRNLSASLNRVLSNRTPDMMAVQKYDIRKHEEEGGGFEERYWSPINTPVFGVDGKIAYIIHRVQDITDFVLLKQGGVEAHKLNEELRERAVQMEAEIYGRAQDIAETNLKLKWANEELVMQREKLRESEQRFASFMFHMPTAAWMKDLHGRYVFANAEAECIFSTPFSKLADKTDEEILPPDTARLFVENDRRVLTEGGSLQTTEFLRQDDGIEHQFIVSKFALPGPDGQSAYVAGVALDITQLKQSEAALQAAEQKLRNIIEYSTNLFYLHSTDQLLTYVSPQSRQFFDCEPEEALVRWTEFITDNPANQTAIETTQRAITTCQRQPPYQVECIGRKGRKIWAEVNEAPVVENGKTVAVVGSLTDITERKRAEEAIRYSEARFRALFYDNPTMILTLDAELTMLSVNPICACQLGYMIAELEGRSVLEIFPEDDRLAVAEQLRKCLQNPDQVFHWQFRKIRKDGKPLWVEETARVISDQNGALNLLVVCQDITERKQAEEEIKNLNASLAARAVELEDVNRELEAFNYTVAHDLRKPLTVVNGYCQVITELCSNNLDETCRGYLRDAYDGTWRMNRLIDALLKFSQMTHVEPQRQMVDLSAVAHDVAEELKQVEPDRRVTFRIADEACAVGDAALLRVVLDNLLGNAWKYTATQEEGIIEFGMTEVDGQSVCFVRDNGNGFDMTDTDKLFSPFQRLPGTEECRGFGIGLATVERIIRRHGGRVWAEGEPGKGACFFFTLAVA